jgi:diaminohydroxyphosphoribosylaminopyrimidine deaminase/5-amino-6-(5-phosphoribosylamino)uracil reductase
MMTTDGTSGILSLDARFMARAMELAWRAAGQTAPNPLVGAVVVADGEIVGEGYHRRCGAAHAEVGALEQAGARCAGGTLYVSLEPCTHHGRTPPCVERITSAGVSRVVVPLIDPDGRVFGRGVEALRATGVEVELGCGDGAALLLNLGYYKQRLGLGRTVTLKMAATGDGKISSAPGRRDDITGDESRRWVHLLRAEHDCVVVGIDTLLSDQPALDCRLVDSVRAPVPVVLDGDLRFPADYRWISEKRPFYVLTGHGADPDKRKRIEAGGGRVLECGRQGGRLDVTEVSDLLSAAGMQRILVEGGAKVFSSFLHSGQWDAMCLFRSPKVFGDGGVSLFEGDAQIPPEAVGVDTKHLQDDVLQLYLNKKMHDEVKSRLEI